MRRQPSTSTTPTATCSSTSRCSTPRPDPGPRRHLVRLGLSPGCAFAREGIAGLLERRVRRGKTWSEVTTRCLDRRRRPPGRYVDELPERRRVRRRRRGGGRRGDRVVDWFSRPCWSSARRNWPSRVCGRPSFGLLPRIARLGPSPSGSSSVAGVPELTRRRRPPSSALIFASSASTWVPAVSAAIWRSRSTLGGRRRSSSAPVVASSSTAAARACICSVLSWRPLHRKADVGHLLAEPVAASPIRTCASAAEYCAFTTSFWVRNASTLADSRRSWSIRFCCCSSSCGDLLVEPLELALDQRLSLERSAARGPRGRRRAPAAPGRRA